MIEFERHSDCQLCPLYQSANNPGLPTRPLYDRQPISKDRALLFVGQSPGHHEDKSTAKNPQGKSFVGYTGGLLQTFAVEGARLHEYCNIFLANACRCKPPQGADESQSQIRICREHLREDIRKLQAHYKEVIIMALGAKACYSVLNLSSLNEALKKQGTRAILPEDDSGQNPRVFCTNHPAILHQLREPGKVRAMEAHFALLLRYLKDEYIPNQLVIVPEVYAPVPKELPALATVDIETYGILKGVEQTVFQPIKSLVVDVIPYEKQVVTVSFAYRDGNTIRTPQYVWNEPSHRQRIREWFERMSKARITCGGQNIKFDLAYLRNDPILRYWIDSRRLIVDDTLLMSFLLYEQQPEKGLKELSTLFGIADYSGVRVTGKSGNAKSAWDKDLHYYNCLDSAATLVLYEELRQRILERYGPDSSKLSVLCAWLRNISVWNTLSLETNGSALNLRRLEDFHKSESSRCEELMQIGEEKFGIKFAGKGSDAPLRQLMLDCIAEAGMVSDTRVEWSKKTGKISIGVENVNLVTPNMPEGAYKETITKYQEYKEHAKIVTTYTRPLLESPRKGIVTRDERVGIVYPSWYPIPLYADRGGSSDDKSGGQIQGRYSCKKPARQTEPRSIRSCSTSRWPGGRLIECDMASDHLRMAALLSGDPELLDAFNDETGPNLHTRTAMTFFPDLEAKDLKKHHPDEYKLGKTGNFAIIFRCGPGTLQQTALHDIGLDLDIEFCAKSIMAWSRRYHIYWKWQDRMIDLAAKQGYLILPTGWSRTFGIGHQNIAGQVGEVLNFLHQCPCAQLTHSCQYKIEHTFLKYRMRSLVCLNIYDALYVDCYPGEYENAKEILFETMNNPPLLPIFEKWTGHKVKWAAEIKEYDK